MTKIAQIEDRGAAVAWSPVQEHADIIALGSKDSGTIGFDDVGGELELYDFGITTSATDKPQPIGSLKTTSRFSSIGWTTGATGSTVVDRFRMGLIAGGMGDGTINVWDASSIVSGGDSSLISTITQQTGAVTALKFNPHAASANLLASGGRNGDILITSLDDPNQPTVTSLPTTQGAEITQLAWNTEVPHIVASSAGNGMASVWDLTKNKAWCELRCEPSGAAVSDMAWNPSQGMLMITASADDRSPVLKLWDLRASMDMPLATMEGHTQGILSFAWCPHDESLLVSCGKDNRTLLWDINTLKPIAELPNETAPSQQGPDTTSASMYDSNLSSSQQKRYDIQWSPMRKGVLSTCSFDRKVQAHSVIGTATKIGRPPKWMKPASGVSCGVGGTIVSSASNDKNISIRTYVEESALKNASLNFESSIASGDYISYSLSKAENAARAGDVYESQVWGFMQVLFEENSRAQVLGYLGLDPSVIKENANKFVANEDLGMSNLSLGQGADGGSPPMSAEAEDIVNEALIVGDFESAVNCCVRSGSFADALVLASYGGAELWAKTQAQYFASEAEKRPFLKIVSAVIHGSLGEYVQGSDPSQWNVTLGVICTYAKVEEYHSLCEALGDHLEAAGDLANASLCFMCALNLEKASKYWQIQLANSVPAVEDYLSLHSFIEKVATFMNVTDSSKELPDVVTDLMFKYAKLLADQGLNASAAKYCRSKSQECKVLADRLYRSKDSQECLRALNYTPEFPFQYVNIGVAPQSSTKRAVASTTVNGSGNGYKQNGTPSRSQQPQQSANPSTVQPAANDQANTAPQLAAGWIALQDPSSGRTYYANQTTGETTWDMPKAPQPALVPAPAPSQPNVTPQKPTQTSSMGNAGSTPAISNALKLSSKYGDGFVSSASHPELGAQYGNLGTSNPYNDTSRTGIAVVNKIEKPPISGTFNPSKPPEVSAEFMPIVESLNKCVTALSPLSLSFSEKKQVAEIEKGAAFFSKRLARNEIDGSIAEKVGQIVSALENRDFSSASTIHTGLVNSDWKEHKDWLKGMKFLIQLTAKRL